MLRDALWGGTPPQRCGLSVLAHNWIIERSRLCGITWNLLPMTLRYNPTC